MCLSHILRYFMNMNGNVIRGLLVTLVGVFLISLSESAMPFLVRLLGLAFFLPALVSLVNLYAKRKGAALISMFAMSVINIGSAVLGIWLLLFPRTFLEFFVIMLALILLCMSLLQIYAVVSSSMSVRKKWGLLAFPLLLTVMSMVLLFKPFAAISTVSIIIGACLVVSGLSDVVIMLMAKKRSVAGLQKR